MDICELFDLVAPIAITGGADCMFMPKAVVAWGKIQRVPLQEWTRYGYCEPRLHYRIDYDPHFQRIYWEFALHNYLALFQRVVADHSPVQMEMGFDRGGCLGYRVPGQTRFQFTGDQQGRFPWYETAQLLIERLALITPARELQYA